MSHYFASQILVLAMLIPVVTRFLFSRSARIDTIVMLAPFSFIVSLLSLFVYGLTVANLAILLVAAYVCFINFRAFLRLCNGLVVDFYHGPFIFGCIISWIMIAGMAGILVFFCPYADMKLSLKGKSAESYAIEKTVYTGSAFGGLNEKTDYFSSPAAVVYEISPKEKKSDVVFVYVSGVCTRTDDFLPGLVPLAEKGYTCLSGDFSVSDIPYFNNWRDSLWSLDYSMRMMRLRKPDEYQERKKAFGEKKVQEAKLLVQIAKERFPGSELVLIYDKENKTGFEMAFPDNKQIVIDLNECAFMALTNPLEAYLLDSNRWNRKNHAANKELPDQIAWYILNSLAVR